MVGFVRELEIEAEMIERSRRLRNERLRRLLNAATVSAVGLDITIACDDYETRNAIMDELDAIPEGAHVDRTDKPVRGE